MKGKGKYFIDENNGYLRDDSLKKGDSDFRICFS